MSSHRPNVMRVEADVDAEAERSPPALMLDLLVAGAAGCQVAGPSGAERMRSDTADVVVVHRRATGILPNKLDEFFVACRRVVDDVLYSTSGPDEGK